ncbi:MAG: hypothetical protein PHP14_00465 [Candidatus Pacebacteria bacterium]|nr:hypothetical protein [Candidatus Paceibacterota bacterium]MDD3808575.1 hypothetical protein [Candidatus Paceibacterota bacterium]
MPFQNQGEVDKTGKPDLDNKIYSKMMGGLYERLNKSDKFGKNDWMTDFQRLYDASKQNQNPDQFLKIFKDFQKTFRQEDM